MTPEQFLRTVWPSEGLYCLALPWVTPQGDTTFFHKVFDKIEDVWPYAQTQVGRRDVYFSMHTLRENTKDGTRTIANMLECKVFFCELDVGDEPARFKKYASREDAYRALMAFCKGNGFPKPVVTKSGRGLHVFWPLSVPLPTGDWRPYAYQLHQLMAHHGLNVDPSKVSDPSAVLRVPGTLHLKDKDNPRPVEVLHGGAETDTGKFTQLIDEGISRAGITPKTTPLFPEREKISDDGWGDNTAPTYDGPPVKFTAVLKTCAQMRALARTYGNVPEPIWYGVMLQTAIHCENADKIGHKLSSGYAGYTEEETSNRMERLRQGKFGPPLCSKIAELCGESLCEGCPVLKIKNAVGELKYHTPVTAARFIDPAEAPKVEISVPGTQVVERVLVNPPEPYIRLKDKGIGIRLTNKDGDQKDVVFLNYDLYPVSRVVDSQAGREEQLWRVHLPRSAPKDFTVAASDLYDKRTLLGHLANQGIYVGLNHDDYLREYMVAYIKELQAAADAEVQHTRFGWDKATTRFVLPDRVLCTDGTVKQVNLSGNAATVAQSMDKAGTLEKQVELLKFFANPAYVANQFFILCGLASPLFFATEQHGAVVNASGEPGASKSTSLFTAASFWGHPKDYPMNGTNSGATTLARQERITTLANLPICLDEITHMNAKEAVDMAMGSSQSTERKRLDKHGKERKAPDTFKSTIVLTTANNSLHTVLASDNAAGTAGSMRVFEIRFKALNVHRKWEADDFLHALRHNYGHIGPVALEYVVKNRDACVTRVRQLMREFDEVCRVQGAERFWTALAATAIAMNEIASDKLGLLAFNTAFLKTWAIQAINAMRGVVTSEYSDPLSLLSDYLETVNNEIMVTEVARGGDNYVVKEPRGRQLSGHYDKTTEIMWVLEKGFRDYCRRLGASSTQTLDYLHGRKIVTNRRARRRLGAGTPHAKTQAWVFGIDMKNEAVSGVVEIVSQEEEAA